MLNNFKIKKMIFNKFKNSLKNQNNQQLQKKEKRKVKTIGM